MDKDFLEDKARSEKWIFWNRIALASIVLIFIGAVGHVPNQYWSSCFLVLGGIVIVKETSDYILEKYSYLMSRIVEEENNSGVILSEEEHQTFWKLASNFDNKKD